MKPLEAKGKAIRKNYTLFEVEITRLDYLMKKYKLDASEVVRQLITNQYDYENDRVGYKYGIGTCKVCGKEEIELYKGIYPKINHSSRLEDRILDNMCKVCFSNRILGINDKVKEG